MTFAVGGTIFLTNTIVISNNTVLDASGRHVSISGSNAVQIFIIDSDATVAMTNLTLLDGLAQGIENWPTNEPGKRRCDFKRRNAATYGMLVCQQ